MGGAMLQRWIDDVPARFTAVNRSGDNIPAGVAHARSAADLDGRYFDAIVIGVKPQQIADVLPDYAGLLEDDGCFISIAAGFSTASLAAALGDRPIVRIMPNLPALIGRGVNGLYANAKCEVGHRNLASALAQSTGRAIWVDTEDEIDRITAIAGSGPGYVFEILRSYIAAAEAMGFDKETARTLVLDTVGGAVEMAARSDQTAEELRNSVMSKQGTTQAGIEALTRDGLLERLIADAAQAAYERARELR